MDERPPSRRPPRYLRSDLAGPAIRPAPLTADIAVGSSALPGDLHGDPADRLIIATARHLGLPEVTRDPRILAYARAGQIAAIEC